MSKKIAVYQGTFDPFTTGHLAVLRAARCIFDEVIVLLLVNPAKTPLFSIEERKNMIEQSVASLSGITVDSYQGLLADYMKEKALVCCVRGIRNEIDCVFELKNHQLSQVFYPALQSIFLPCDTQYNCVSSSAVKEACRCGTLPSSWVTSAVSKMLLTKYPHIKLI